MILNRLPLLPAKDLSVYTVAAPTNMALPGKELICNGFEISGRGVGIVG
jgi:hypothetical protein